ncbi:MAG: RraA family protein [Pseudorhodoplanes sp.]|uniref:RraA family protein n=1 Tax=Pseudorhodoplanes sp. TaxID=1934341 RepID=UPI003D1415FF
MPIGFQINPRASKIDPSLLEAFRGIPAPIVSDNMSRMFGGGADLRPRHRGGSMLGVALTVRARPGDNLMAHKAIDMAEPGDVIVIDAGGDLTNAIFGEIMMRLAIKRGAAGVVVDGAIRDCDVIAAGDFPVYSKGITHRGPYKDGPGEINVTVTVGGQTVTPGDIIIGDMDGMLAIPRHAAVQVAASAREQLRREVEILASIDNGTVDRTWVDEILRAKGLVV